MNRKASPLLKRILRGFGLFILTAVLLLYLGLPAGMGIAALFPAKQNVGAPPEGFRTVTLTTQDRVRLKGWFHPGTNGAAILVLHGAGGSRQDVQAVSELLARHHFGVLALDLRGHGESEGKTNRFGWQSGPDVRAGVDFLQSQPGVQSIGGLGLSLGGETLLGAASQNPALHAIVSDGASQRCTAELITLPSEKPLVRSFTARVMYAVVQLLSGQSPPMPLIDSLHQAKDTHFYFITGGAAGIEVQFNQFFAKEVGSQGELWIAPDAQHTASFVRYPQEFEQRVLGFFERSLTLLP